ncbi:MAG TPA: hypothetical protein VJ993_06805, partial [Woeseiaceae bacterium]|nr:hypothetical protein [Woeseiaceae bacterium]
SISRSPRGHPSTGFRDRKKKDAEIERAKGIAEANKIINSSLTAEYLQHEVNTALLRFADNDGSIVVIPANMQGFEMILDSGQLRRGNE